MGIDLNVVSGAVVANQLQKERMAQKLLNLFDGDIKNKTIAILGLAFKAQTDDIRESPAIEIINTLNKNGALIRAFDPAANENMKKRFNDLKTFDSWEEAVKDADGVVIMTEWNEFRGLDLLKLKGLLKSPVLLDCRNILRMDDLETMGFKYDNVGRKKR